MATQPSGIVTQADEPTAHGTTRVLKITRPPPPPYSPIAVRGVPPGGRRRGGREGPHHPGGPQPLLRPRPGTGESPIFRRLQFFTLLFPLLHERILEISPPPAASSKPPGEGTVFNGDLAALLATLPRAPPTTPPAPAKNNNTPVPPTRPPPQGSIPSPSNPRMVNPSPGFALDGPRSPNGGNCKYDDRASVGYGCRMPCNPFRLPQRAKDSYL